MIWQWCPATVTWSADVTNGPSPPQASQAVIGLPAPQTTASYRAQTFPAAPATNDPIH